MRLIFGFDIMTYNGPIPNCFPPKFFETIYVGGNYNVNKASKHFMEKWKTDIPLFYNHDYESFIEKKSVYQIIEDKKNGKNYDWYYIVEPHSGLDLFFGNHPIHDTFLLNYVSEVAIEEMKTGNCKLLINYTVDGGLAINQTNFQKIFNFTRNNKIKDENVFLIFSDFELKNNIKNLGYNYNVFDYNFYMFLKSHEFNKILNNTSDKCSVVSKDEFLMSVNEEKKDFLLLTRHWKKHRIFLLNKIHRLGLEKSLVSWEKSFYDERYINELLKRDENIEFIDLLKNTSKYVDVDDIVNVMGINNENKWIYLNTYLSVVTETIFFQEDKSFPTGYLSEKIWKPIGHCQPFILAGPAFSLKYIRERYNYKTFHPFIDESYDEEYDDYKRLNLIELELEKFSKKTQEEKIKFLHDVKDICIHNRNVFLNYGVINGHNSDIRKIIYFLNNDLKNRFII